METSYIMHDGSCQRFLDSRHLNLAGHWPGNQMCKLRLPLWTSIDRNFPAHQSRRYWRVARRKMPVLLACKTCLSFGFCVSPR